MTGVSEAFVAVVEAVSRQFDTTPLAKGLLEVEAGDWSIALNTTNAPIASANHTDPVTAFGVIAKHNRYLVIAMLDPAGGIVGGMDEGDFIREMEAIPARSTPSNANAGRES